MSLRCLALLALLIVATADTGNNNATALTNITDSSTAADKHSQYSNATDIAPVGAEASLDSLDTPSDNDTEATAAQWSGHYSSRHYDRQHGWAAGRDYQPGGGLQPGNPGNPGNVPQRGPSLPSCPPGQGRPSPTEACQPCPYGRYSPGGLRGPCLRCPPGSITITAGATQCGCRPGTGVSTLADPLAPGAAFQCDQCPIGTYSPGGSIAPCTRCPGSAFMVTPPAATRVSQCTCSPGYGSTPDFPNSCQMCPIGTYADAVAQIIDIPGVPPQGGKGITGGLIGATIKPCKPCCPAGVGTCGYTTKQPGSRAFSDCVLAAPPASQYCCGVPSGANCTYSVPVPPNFLPTSAAAAAARAAALPDFEWTYQGVQVSVVEPVNVITQDGNLVTPLEDAIASQTFTITGGQPPTRRGSSSWGGGGGGGSSSGGSWGGGGGGDDDGSDGNSWSRGSSGGSSSWGGRASSRSRGWGATITGGVIFNDSLGFTSQELPDSEDSSSSSSSQQEEPSSSSSIGGISSTDQVPWWGATQQQPHAEPLGLCSAFPRVAETNLVGLAANTPWVLSYWADYSSGSSCQYTPTKGFAVTACTGSQLAPYLVLTAAHCVDPTTRQGPLCPNLRLAKVDLCYSFNRQPNGTFQCSNPVKAVGVSYNSNPTILAPYDQAIIFTGTRQAGPYYKYNYIENIPGAYNSTSNTFQSLSYSGDGKATDRLCGCAVCDRPCGLGRSGPAPGPLVADANPNAAGNGAVNAQLEACGGSSGNLMTINGRDCGVAVDSYEYRADESGTACSNLCANYWSTISVSKPLIALWGTVQQQLPYTP